MTTDIQEKKENLIKWIEEMDDVTLIEQLNALKKNSEKLSSSDLASIQKGMDQVKNGQTKPYDEVIKPYEKYLQG